MSENDFQNIAGDSYRGSKYSNFTGGGTDPQGNVTSAATENSSNFSGTSSDAPPTPTSPSQGLTGGSASDMVIGAALPYAGGTIGQAAGAVIGAGGTVGEGLSAGFSSLGNKISGGLIGSAPTATGLGQGIGQAAQGATKASNLGQFGSGANVGAAVGSGFMTAAATLLTGGSVKDAAKAGIGTAVGTAIGNAVLPGIGGFVGGYIGSLFCFAADTPILLLNGAKKAIKDIDLGEKLMGGGTVTGWGKGFAETLYSYKNTEVTGSHAVFEDGRWIRVKDSKHAVEMPCGQRDVVVYPVSVDNQLVVTPWFIAADIFEISPEEGDSMTDDERIAALNSQQQRNNDLLVLENMVCKERHLDGVA